MVQQQSLVEYGARRVIITITCILCALLEIVDTTIVNVALNNMKGSLGASTSEVGWVITAYAIGNVIIVPMTSWLAQQFGRRNYFAVSIIIFTVCSFLCGNAHGIWELVAFRFVQGLGGGALLVTSQTIITESYPPEKRSMATAIYGMGVIIGPTLGPPLGGYIVDHSTWPYIFYINIPLGVIAALFTMTFVKSPVYGSKSAVRDIDFIGIALLALAVGSLQYVLEKGQDDNWFSDHIIVILTICSILGFFFFIWRELYFRNPIVELRVLRNGNLRVGTIMSFMLGFGLYGSTFLIPLYVQSILGWTATQAGVLMIPAALTTAFMMPIIGKLLEKGAKVQILVGLGLLAFAIFCFRCYSILTPDTSSEAFFWPLIMRGVGMGLLFIPITALSLSTLKGKEIGQGAAFTGMMRQLGGSFSIALITTFLARKITEHSQYLSINVNSDNPLAVQRLAARTRAFIANGSAPNEATAKAYKSIQGDIFKQASVLSYMDVFFWLAAVFLFCIPFILIVKNKKSAEKVDLSSVH